MLFLSSIYTYLKRVHAVGETVNKGVGTATSVSEWTTAYFSAGDAAKEKELHELIREARDEFDDASAIQWAHGYTFPSEYVDSNVRCLRAAQLDFAVMVRRIEKQFSGDRLNEQRRSELGLVTW